MHQPAQTTMLGGLWGRVFDRLYYRALAYISQLAGNNELARCLSSFTFFYSSDDSSAANR